MNENQLQSSHHNSIRTFLRVGGPLFAGLGLILIAVGMGSFFSSFGSSGPPRFFWFAFVGTPLLFIGLVMCKFGYMSAVYRYMAGETAPVVKDTVNYIGENTQPGVKAISKAVADGVKEAHQEQQRGE